MGHGCHTCGTPNGCVCPPAKPRHLMTPLEILSKTGHLPGCSGGNCEMMDCRAARIQMGITQEIDAKRGREKTISTRERLASVDDAWALVDRLVELASARGFQLEITWKHRGKG